MMQHLAVLTVSYKSQIVSIIGLFRKLFVGNAICEAYIQEPDSVGVISTKKKSVNNHILL